MNETLSETMPSRDFGRLVTAKNGAEVGFDIGRSEYHKTVYMAKLISGHWPDREELLEMADGGGELAAYFGGDVEQTAYPDFKRVTVFTD